MFVDELKLFTGKDIKVCDGITIRQPLMSEIADYGENEYQNMLSAFTSEPFDLPYQLSQVGIDYTLINSFDLFYLLVQSCSPNETRILFGDLDFRSFRRIETENGVILQNSDGVVITPKTREIIADTIRIMHRLPKQTITQVANEFTKNLLINEGKKSIDRAKRRKELFGETSAYQPLISSLAYEWRSWNAVYNLTVSQFFDSIIRMNYKEHSMNLYRGVYSGNVSIKDINKKELDWMRPVKIKSK